MATYYVDFVNGADANNGLGPDASAGTNKPWKTITKLLGAAGMASGDTAYLSPAGPFRETVSVAMTSATAETKILGDPANVQGFKTSGGVAVEPGPVILTAYTTNNKTAPSATTLLNLNARDFLTFQNIMFVGGAAIMVAGGTDATNIVFTNCVLYGTRNNSVVTVIASAGTALNWTIDRCILVSLVGNASVIVPTCTTASTGADYDISFIVKNSSILAFDAAAGIVPTPSGALTFEGNGVHLTNCLVMTAGVGFSSNSASLSNTVANTVKNCVFFSGTATCLQANATGGLITEDYNLLITSGTVRSNVTAGTHSISDLSYAPLFHLGQERIWGGMLRAFGEPMAASPLLAFGNDGTQTAYDLYNNPRPAGGVSALPAVGALERGNTWGKETGTVRTGSNALSITGPGYQDFDVPVDATSTTVSVYMRFDATYAGTKPQLQVLNGEECGVAAATSLAVTTVNTWEQLSLTFVPTAKGIVTIRLLSSDTNGAGKAFADDFAVA